MTILLRKGGIRESTGELDRLLQRDRALLFPTLEHQKSELLKPDYADRVEPVPSGWHPDSVTLRAWIEIQQVLPVTNLERALDLVPFLVWNDAFVRDRWHWKPDRPLYAILLRTYRLSPAQTIPFLPAYRGCRSRVEITPEITLDLLEPVIDDTAFPAIATALNRILRDDEC
ncbi:MAG: DUF1802 family protein [Oscillatoriales cyanobacterium]|nr:MAG: DUF1802 family protein [Oscillatoriales cyanobacterium]